MGVTEDNVVLMGVTECCFNGSDGVSNVVSMGVTE